MLSLALPIEAGHSAGCVLFELLPEPPDGVPSNSGVSFLAALTASIISLNKSFSVFLSEEFNPGAYSSLTPRG